MIHFRAIMASVLLSVHLTSYCADKSFPEKFVEALLPRNFQGSFEGKIEFKLKEGKGEYLKGFQCEIPKPNSPKNAKGSLAILYVKYENGTLKDAVLEFAPPIWVGQQTVQLVYFDSHGHVDLKPTNVPKLIAGAPPYVLQSPDIAGVFYINTLFSELLYGKLFNAEGGHFPIASAKIESGIQIEAMSGLALPFGKGDDSTTSEIISRKAAARLKSFEIDNNNIVWKFEKVEMSGCSGKIDHAGISLKLNGSDFSMAFDSIEVSSNPARVIFGSGHIGGGVKIGSSIRFGTGSKTFLSMKESSQIDLRVGQLVLSDEVFDLTLQKSPMKVDILAGQLGIGKGFLSLDSGQIVGEIEGRWHRDDKLTRAKLSISALDLTLSGGQIPLAERTLIPIDTGRVVSTALELDTSSEFPLSGRFDSMKLRLMPDSYIELFKDASMRLGSRATLESGGADAPIIWDNRHSYPTGRLVLNASFKSFDFERSADEAVLHLGDGSILMSVLAVPGAESVRFNAERLHLDSNTIFGDLPMGSAGRLKFAPRRDKSAREKFAGMVADLNFSWTSGRNQDPEMRLNGNIKQLSAELLAGSFLNITPESKLEISGGFLEAKDLVINTSRDRFVTGLLTELSLDLRKGSVISLSKEFVATLAESPAAIRSLSTWVIPEIGIFQGASRVNAMIDNMTTKYCSISQGSISAEVSTLNPEKISANNLSITGMTNVKVDQQANAKIEVTARNGKLNYNKIGPSEFDAVATAKLSAPFEKTLSFPEEHAGELTRHPFDLKLRINDADAGEFPISVKDEKLNFKTSEFSSKIDIIADKDKHIATYHREGKILVFGYSVTMQCILLQQLIKATPQVVVACSEKLSAHIKGAGVSGVKVRVDGGGLLRSAGEFFKIFNVEDEVRKRIESALNSMQLNIDIATIKF